MSTSSAKKLPLIYSILESPAYGGAEQYLLSNLRFLSQQGYPVCLATNLKKVEEQALILIKEFKLKDFSIITFPFRLDAIGNWKGLLKFFFWSPFALSWQLLQFIELRKNHSQIICYWAGFSDRLLLSPIAKIFGCTIIWIEIGPLEPTFKKTWGFPKILYKLTKSLPHHFITTSLWTKQSMVSSGQINPNDISLIYPGVLFPNSANVKTLKESGEKWRGENGLRNKFLVSFIGRMAKENEVEVLLKAVSLLSKSFHENIFTVLVGDGPEKNGYESLARSLNLQDNTLFTGFVSQDEKLSIVSTSDLFVFARAWNLDGFGMTPLEGMSVEVPVITTDFGPQKEIVEDTVNGLRFAPHDAKDLAKKIHQMISSPVLRKRLAKQGRISLSPKFTEATMHHKTLQVIQKKT